MQTTANGIKEYRFKYKKTILRFINIGSARKCQNKILHRAQLLAVTTAVYVASSCAFAENNYCDEGSNDMKTSLDFIRDLAKFDFDEFVSSISVVLTHADLLEEKVSVMDTVVNAHAYGLLASTPSHARMRTLFSLPPAFHKKASQTE